MIITFETLKRILFIIVLSQFLCTSLWFAGNAIMPDIIKYFNTAPGYLANLISAVQLGFITGTLIFAFLAIADRFSPSKVFFCCATLGALCNLPIIFIEISPRSILISRFLTGFFLAGIYPIGMKIAADHFKKGLGRSLGFLVGALVAGTALPHLIRTITLEFHWKYMLMTISALSVIGGVLILSFVTDGQYRKQLKRFQAAVFIKNFRNRNFRSAALGYFGHMWELYAFWVFVPVMLASHYADDDVAWMSFTIIGVGAIACAVSGMISQRFGVKNVATASLLLSGICCLVSPFVLPNQAMVVGFLIFWGIVVIADSPLFSTLVAQNAEEQTKGSSITIVNCIGFAITIVSIQFIQYLSNRIDNQYIYMFLAIGPVLGLYPLLTSGKHITATH
jgi:MFS family permease